MTDEMKFILAAGAGVGIGAIIGALTSTHAMTGHDWKTMISGVILGAFVVLGWQNMKEQKAKAEARTRELEHIERINQRGW